MRPRSRSTLPPHGLLACLLQGSQRGLARQAYRSPCFPWKRDGPKTDFCNRDARPNIMGGSKFEDRLRCWRTHTHACIHMPWQTWTRQEKPAMAPSSGGCGIGHQGKVHHMQVVRPNALKAYARKKEPGAFADVLEEFVLR